MNGCTRDLRAGKFRLKLHDPGGALKSFHSALNHCKLDDDRLAEVLYYLGVALMRLGKADPAIKSWLSAHRLKRKTFALQMLKRYSNCYGMVRQERVEVDDWRAFLSIQLLRYLVSKRKKRFSSEPERDMVRDLVVDHWKTIEASGVLSNKTAEEKRDLFGSINIVFPFTRLPESGESVIPVDFRAKRRMASSDRCPCGSGLTFMTCCGRLNDLEDLANGVF